MSESYSRDENKEQELAQRLAYEEARGNLPPVVLETFTYFNQIIKELETRISILENNTEILRQHMPPG